MRIAIIDCGTNTFHLMIAETGQGTYEIVSTEKTTVKIGEGGIEKKIITDAAFNRAVTCLSAYRQKINSENVSIVHAFATSAFRNAANGTLLRDTILQKTGIKIQIIPGDEEAELIYEGVRLALDMKQETSLIMDIGGGSVEFIIGNNENIYWKQSFEIGAQRLLDRFYTIDPISTEAILSLENYLETSLQPLAEAIHKYQPSLLVGASGTFDTLSAMNSLKHNLPVCLKAPELPLTLEEYKELHEQIVKTSREQRLNMPGMVEMRVDMIVVASCLINFIITQFPFGNLRVSSYALKEGVLSRVIN